MKTLLSVKNLNVSFGNQKILEDVSFEVEKGESLAIVGPNGAGKTILFKALLGLTPFSGEIKWQPNVKIGYVPQKIDFDRYLPMSLGDFLLAKARILNLPAEIVEEKLNIVGFSQETLKTGLGNLSFGQFQKALIVFALIGDPDVLLLDEATLGVDAPYETYIYEIIRRLEKERALTTLLISHEVEIVYRYTTRVLCLNRKMICIGPPQEALNEETLKSLYKEATVYHHRH
ncbi:metal ABC transporter ATP-binding protein [Candidatus Wolfebacteria bacterium]|nr:metal ABC transporter ATP-binding protein [Candidatus Wolfebacteria bacterium]